VNLVLRQSIASMLNTDGMDASERMTVDDVNVMEVEVTGDATSGFQYFVFVELAVRSATTTASTLNDEQTVNRKYRSRAVRRHLLQVRGPPSDLMLWRRERERVTSDLGALKEETALCF
jgi:hypothetical protein